MIKAIIVLTFISFLSHATTNICDNKQFDDLSKIAIPNCYNTNKISDAQSGNTESLCTTCKKEFELKSLTKTPALSEEEKRKILASTAIKEYKKVLINNLLNVVKLRATNSTGIDFKESKVACNFQKNNLPIDTCKSSFGKQLLSDDKFFTQISNEASREIAKIMSNDSNYSPTSTLLTRPTNQCFIKEQDVLTATMAALEESFSPQMIKKIKTMDASKYPNMDYFLAGLGEFYDGDIEEISAAIKSHPLLNIQFKDPAKAISFFKTIPDPEDTFSLKKSLYNQTNGIAFDKELAASCSESTKALFDTICEDDKNTETLKLDPFKNLSRISDYKEDDESEIIKDDNMFRANQLLLMMCDPNVNKGNKSLNDKLTPIVASLLPSYQKMSLSQFQTKKYITDIGAVNDYVCKGKCADPVSLNCKVMQKILNPEKHVNSLDRKIASSSNSEINDLLRSMLGKPDNIDSKTKEILVANGILPKADGTITTQPEIPERKPAQYAEAIQNQRTVNSRTASTLSPSNSSNQAYNQNQASKDDYSSSSDFNSSGSSSSSQTASSEALDNLRDQEKELRNVQNEIRRRLANLPNNKPSTTAQAKQIAEGAYQSQGMSYTPEDLNRRANEMMASTPNQQRVVNQASYQPSQQNQSATSGGDSAAQKFRDNAGNRALMGMAGAQQSELNDNKNSPSQQGEKSLTKVALHVADDPKVNLSETLTKKLDPNDPETRVIKDLLKKQSNFLLQLKSVNFKVVFTDNNNFNLLLESGDKNEAERIRPQLEIFLNKIKRNNTLHNLSQSWST